MKRSVFVLFLVATGYNAVQAQSYHFSQFFSTPLLTNPANTGLVEAPFRASSNIRSQGVGGNPVFTGYLSTDFSLFRNTLAPGNKFGAGMYVMNDQSLSNAVNTNSVGLSTAYHVGFDIYGEHSFGFGVQGTYNQRRIDYSKLNFENQYGPAGYDPNLPVGEPMNATSKSFFDLNAGVIYNASLPDKAFFVGASAYNILAHKENIIGDEFKMPRRYTLQAGGKLMTGNSGNIYMSLTAMNQAKATEVTLGGGYGVAFTENADELIGGLWYRYNDAVIPYIGYQSSKFQVGFSYDYTVSSIKSGAQVRNGYELTLIYKAADKRELKTNISWY